MEGSGVENADFLLDVDENGLEEAVSSLQLASPSPQKHPSPIFFLSMHKYLRGSARGSQDS